MKIRSVLVSVCVAAAGFAFADSTPVMVSLVTPVQAPDRHHDVEGVRLSLIYGECQDFSGLDLGIINNTRGEFKGLAIGGLNMSDKRLCGGQLGLVNFNNSPVIDWGERSVGAQIGLWNYADSFCGFQYGAVNISDGSFTGLQQSFINVANEMTGAQIGYDIIFGVNIAEEVRGCQIGLVNYAESVEGGLQIGLVNIIRKNGWAPALPIVNSHF